MMHNWGGPTACCRSMKEDKRIAASRYRANANLLVKMEGEDYIERDRHEFKFGSNWVWGCDGHGLYGSMAELMAFVADADDPKAWYHKMLAK